MSCGCRDKPHTNGHTQTDSDWKTRHGDAQKPKRTVTSLVTSLSWGKIRQGQKSCDIPWYRHRTDRNITESHTTAEQVTGANWKRQDILAQTRGLQFNVVRHICCSVSTLHLVWSRHVWFLQPTPRDNVGASIFWDGGEIQGESESLNRQNPQMTLEPCDFSSIQGEGLSLSSPQWTSISAPMCRRIINHCFPLKHIDVTRSTDTNLDVMQDKRMDDLLDLRRQQKLVRFMERTQYVVVQTFGRKLVKPVRIERSKNGQKRSRSSTMLEDSERFTSSIQMMKNTEKSSKMRGETGKPMAPAMPCKDYFTASRKWVATPEVGSEKSSETVSGCAVESHNPWGNGRNLLNPKIMKIAS